MCRGEEKQRQGGNKIKSCSIIYTPAIFLSLTLTKWTSKKSNEKEIDQLEGKQRVTRVGRESVAPFASRQARCDYARDVEKSGTVPSNVRGKIGGLDTRISAKTTISALTTRISHSKRARLPKVKTKHREMVGNPKFQAIISATLPRLQPLILRHLWLIPMQKRQNRIMHGKIPGVLDAILIVEQGQNLSTHESPTTSSKHLILGQREFWRKWVKTWNAAPSLKRP